jgi:hypothetical protein
MSGVTVLLMVVFIGIGSVAWGKWFRLYSILTIAAMLIFGALVAMQAPNVAAQLPTPWMGIMERVSVFSPMIWILVLSTVQLRSLRTEFLRVVRKENIDNVQAGELAA